MTTPLQISRWDRLLRRLGNVVGEGAIATGMLEDVFPVLDVENLQTDSWHYTGWRIAQGANTVAAAAGQTPRIFLDNPPGSNKLVIVDQISMFADATTEVRIGPNPLTAARAATGPSLLFDMRYEVSSGGAAMDLPTTTTFGESSLGPVPNDAGRFSLQVANRMESLIPFKGMAVLPPGRSLSVRGLTVAATLTVTFFFRERVGEPAELI